MKRLAIMQPYFFPYLGYFQAIHAVDKYIVYDNLNLIKESWMNRNSFLVKNGKPAYFIAEVQKKSSFKKIYEIELNEGVWRKKMLNSIFLNYKSAPAFETVYDIIEKQINAPVSTLAELNYNSINCVCDYLGIKTEITRDYKPYLSIEDKLLKEPLENDDFPEIEISNSPKKEIRVLAICKQEGANEFVNAIGGENLYSKFNFSKNNIKLSFIKSKPHQYNQQADKFYPNLSIIDILMNCGKEEALNLIENYEFV